MPYWCISLAQSSEIMGFQSAPHKCVPAYEEERTARGGARDVLRRKEGMMRICPFSRYALRSNFYVSLTRSRSLASAEKLLNGMERGFLWTGIGPAATGILGVFPGCTSRQRCMYIYPPRKSLIVKTGKERVRTGCISSLFYTQR